MTKTQLELALDAVGGDKALAYLLDVQPSQLYQWVNARRPIPKDYLPALEFISGLRCEEAWPEVEWARNEAGRIVGYVVRFSKLEERFPRMFASPMLIGAAR